MLPTDKAFKSKNIFLFDKVTWIVYAYFEVVIAFEGINYKMKWIMDQKKPTKRFDLKITDCGKENHGVVYLNNREGPCSFCKFMKCSALPFPRLRGFPSLPMGLLTKDFRPGNRIKRNKWTTAAPWQARRNQGRVKQSGADRAIVDTDGEFWKF